MSWKFEGKFPSGMSLWTHPATEKFSDISVHSFESWGDYTLTMGMNQVAHFSTLEAAQKAADDMINWVPSPKTRRKSG
jgi:hypothetical protein